MKKLIIIIFIIIGISLLFRASPLRIWYSKFTLSNNDILAKLNFSKEDCKFHGATFFGGDSSPGPSYVVCLTKERYKPTSIEQKTAIVIMRNILEKNGWAFSSKESWKDWDITYTKGFRKIRIYPYDWDPNSADGFKLFADLN